MSDATFYQKTSKKLIDILPYDILWIDRGANILYANQSVCKSLGYSASEMSRMSMYDINPTLNADKWKDHWQIVQEKKVDHFKTHHQKKNGENKFVDVYSLYFSNNGNDLICAIIQDISESIFYRRILEETEKAVLVGGWKWNLIDKTVIASQVALDIFNAREPEELLPSNILHKFVDPRPVKDGFRNVLRNGHSLDITLPAKIDGVSKWIRCILSPQGVGDQVEKIYGTYQDVTKQRNREQMLSLASRIIDNANDIIFVWEKSGKLFRFNDEAIRELGFSREELSKTTIYDLDGTITPEWWADHFEDLHKNKSLTFEWIATRKNSTRFPVEIKASLIPFERRHLNFAILRNITGRKKRELELRDALEEIKQLKNQLQIENEYLQEEIKLDHNFEEIICQSEAYKEVLHKIERVAPTESTILITGESGTGKELLARTAHQLSSRKDKPLIKVNCATLPKDLIESELFGHKKGAFTGAIADKLGKFELANNGTIFLDEIGELPLELQPKLLRVLQEGEFDRLGGSKTTTVDIRVIAATNRNLEQMVKEGKFREDLYYRLNVFPIYNIPLRERKSDIPLLAQFFLQKYSVKSGRSFKRLSKSTIDKLLQYDFPGNIRELENIIERAVILESGTTLFPGSWMPVNTIDSSSQTQFSTFEEAQKKHIVDVLFHTKWRVSGQQGAAKILDIKEKTLFAKMKKLGIRKEDYLKR